MTRSLFDATRIHGMDLRNRLVRSATWEGLADERGEVTDRLVDIYDALGRGGVGLVISSYAFVSPDGRQHPTQLGAHRDATVPGLARLADAVHRHGGSLVAQLVHCGAQAGRPAIGGRQPVGPSAVESPGYTEVPRGLSAAEVERIIGDFAAAARRAKAAGFDGVQLHGAHGYLLAQFLSPLRNRREDRYGGDLAGRMRLAREVYAAVRAEVGPDFPLMIKLNSHDFLEGSTTEEDSCALAAALAEDGIDAIEVSGGTPGSRGLGPVRSKIAEPADEAYFLPQARAIRAAAPAVPLMLVGGLRSLGRIEAIVEAGDADYISLCRPLIREPDLPARWQRGERSRAACISCSGCFRPARRGEGLRCVELDGDAAA